MILSKTMRPEDFTQLEPELAIVDSVLAMINGGDKAQHPMRRWEYAMAIKAYNFWKTLRERREPLLVSDHGCCTGMLAPTMFWMGNNVKMYEVWAWGNQEEFTLKQMEMVRGYKQRPAETTYEMLHRPLSGLLPEDHNVDVGFCISTLEHIPNYEAAFRDLCRSVGKGGMLFLTTDSAEDEQDHYIAAHVRAGTMFNRTVYERLVGWGQEEGFDLLGGQADWSWDESCRLVNNYGFAALAMERIK